MAAGYLRRRAMGSTITSFWHGHPALGKKGLTNRCLFALQCRAARKVVTPLFRCRKKKASGPLQEAIDAAVRALSCFGLFTLELGFKPLPLAQIQTGDGIPKVTGG